MCRILISSYLHYQLSIRYLKIKKLNSNIHGKIRRISFTLQVNGCVEIIVKYLIFESF